MGPEKVALEIAIVILACGALGLLLQRALPERYTIGPARDMVGAIVGLLTLLSALTLGLLIWTAYGVYAGQNVAVQTLAAKVLQLDMALEDYGPEAKPTRIMLRQRLGKAIDEIWNADMTDGEFVAKSFAAALAIMKTHDGLLAKLQPATDEQRTALATANAALDAIGQSRLQMSFALSAPVSYPLVWTVVSWVALGFLGNGLMSKGSPTSVIAIVLGALAMASAFYMILDLSSPYMGVFRPSPAPLEQVLAVMGKE